MGTIIGSGRKCVLVILFQLYDCRVGLFQGDLFWGMGGGGEGVSMTPKLSYWNKVNPILIQFLSNLCKIILSQKTSDIILSMLTSLVFL